MLTDPTLKNIVTDGKEMNLDDKYTFFLLLRKNLKSKEIEDILLGQESFEEIRERYPNLIYKLVYLKRGDFVRGPREVIMVNMKCPTENPETFNTVACLGILRESSTNDRYGKVSDEHFEELKDISRRNMSIDDAIESSYTELAAIQNSYDI